MSRATRVDQRWWLRCLGLAAGVSVALNVVAHFTTHAVALREGAGTPTIAPDVWPGFWVRWDAWYYLRVAEVGYADANTRGFWPLFPFAMRSVSAATGFSLPTAGALISHASFLIALLLVYRTARILFGEDGRTDRSVLLFALFPTSFFYLALYAEPLFAVFALGAIHLALARFWIAAGVLTGLACLARPVGWLLGVFLLAEFLRSRPRDRHSFTRFAIGGCIAAVGVAGHLILLQVVVGDAWAFHASQALWQRVYQAPWLTLAESVQIAVSGNGVADDWFLYASNLGDLGVTLAGIALGVRALCVPRLRSLGVFVLASIAFFLSTRGPSVVPLWAMTRWVGTLVPLPFILADWIHGTRLEKPAIGVSAAGLLFLTAWWTSGRWVG